MIRNYKESDLPAVMKIWLDSNVETHSFIPDTYWADNYEMVKTILPDAEIYIYEDDVTKEICGFIGLTDDYVAGLFVKCGLRSRGIGKKLLDHVKNSKGELWLKAYEKNIPAIRFYKRELFWQESSRLDEDTNEKELLMRWKK